MWPSVNECDCYILIMKPSASKYRCFSFFKLFFFGFFECDCATAYLVTTDIKGTSNSAWFRLISIVGNARKNYSYTPLYRNQEQRKCAMQEKTRNNLKAHLWFIRYRQLSDTLILTVLFRIKKYFLLTTQLWKKIVNK